MTEDLMRWYDQNARILPWRGIHDPYKTWISEIMLQQTRVDTVIPYFNRFISCFPDVSSLASAPIEKVLKQWEGLGYYRRARNLHLGAQQIMNEFDGTIPSDPSLLMKVTGIGRYTAGAIASIAYNVPVTAIDGNVQRVFSRYFGIRNDITSRESIRTIEELDRHYMCDDRPGDYNQAIMDLGATVCIPGTPNCHHCPIAQMCNARLKGDADQLPLTPEKPIPKQINYDVFLILSPHGVLMKQRTEKMLEGLWLFPLLENRNSSTTLLPSKIVPSSEPIYMGNARHVFTHQIWNMKVYLFDTNSLAPKGYRYIAMEDLTSITIPSAMRQPMYYLLEHLKKRAFEE